MIPGGDPPDVEYTVYGDTGNEVLANYHELMQGLKGLTSSKPQQ
jgi:hypothetical protein